MIRRVASRVPPRGAGAAGAGVASVRGPAGHPAPSAGANGRAGRAIPRASEGRRGVPRRRPPRTTWLAP